MRREKSKQASMNVLMKDGSAKRLPADECDRLVDSGQAKRFISNTVYKAIKLGIEVKDPSTRDEKGELRKLIAAARGSETAKRQKSEAKKREKQKEHVKNHEAQEVLNSED